MILWWTDFGVPFGSEPGYRRPAVVVQGDALNKSSVRTVLLVPLTRTLEWAAAPGNVLCRPKDTGLKRASVANVSQLTVADRRRLVERAGTLSAPLMLRIEDGMKLVLGM